MYSIFSFPQYTILPYPNSVTVAEFPALHPLVLFRYPHDKQHVSDIAYPQDSRQTVPSDHSLSIARRLSYDIDIEFSAKSPVFISQLSTLNSLHQKFPGLVTIENSGLLHLSV